MNDQSISCLNCTRRNNSLFSDLSNEELKRINEDRYCVNYKLGEVICRTGTKPMGLICLNKGKVKILRKGVNGTDQIIGLKKAVDFIGFRALMGGNSCLASYVALEDSTICVIKKKKFYKVIEGNSKLALKIMKSLAMDLIKSDGRLVNLTQKHVRARLADALILINDIEDFSLTVQKFLSYLLNNFFISFKPSIHSLCYLVDRQFNMINDRNNSITGVNKS